MGHLLINNILEPTADKVIRTIDRYYNITGKKVSNHDGTYRITIENSVSADLLRSLRGFASGMVYEIENPQPPTEQL